MEKPSGNTPPAPSADRLIQDNTVVGTTPLVPEIQIRLLTDHSPLWQAFGETPPADMARPYWAFAWSGGQALARYVLDHAALVAGRHVLDFGAGCGISAIAAAKAGARKVSAADIDPVAIAATHLNAQQNGVGIHTRCEDLIYTENKDWEVILAGDVWYDSRMFRHGLPWLRTMAGQGTRVITADPGRAYSPSHGMKPLANYTCRSVPDLEHPNLQTVCVRQILSRQNLKCGQ